MESFGQRLKTLRREADLSQAELANRLNVSRQTVSKWEVGESSPDMEKLVAETKALEEAEKELEDAEEDAKEVVEEVAEE